MALFILFGGADAADASLELVTKWGAPGTGDGQLQQPLGAAVDATGSVYIADSNNSRIQKFTSAGTFILKWGSFGSNDGQLGTPKGVTVDPAGNVYVVDSGNYRVQKFSSTGTFLQVIGVGQFLSNPQNAALGPNGHLYVTEPSRVVEFDASGAFVRTWGSNGSTPGQFVAARGIAVAPSGTVYVADASNSRVQTFTADGTFVSAFGTRASGPGQIAGPTGIAIAPDGHVFVGDPSNAAIVEFAADGTWIERNTTVSGETYVPQGLAFDPSGDLYVTDNQANTGNRVLQMHRVAVAPPLPPPVVGKTVNVAVERGKVLVKLPKGTQMRLADGRVAPAAAGFVPLTGSAQIPVGAFVDVTKGQVGMVSSTGTAANVQKGSFYSGQFQVTQRSARNAFTDLRLSGRLTCSKRRPHSAANGSRRLWGNVKGRFRTRGRHSVATVRGTQWLTKDSCNSTLTLVRDGTVLVRDLAKHKTVTVGKGQRYVARGR